MMMANTGNSKPAKLYNFSDQFPAVGAFEDPSIRVVEPEEPQLDKSHTDLVIVTSSVKDALTIREMYDDVDIPVMRVKSGDTHEHMIKLLDKSRNSRKINTLTVYCEGTWCFFGLDKGMSDVMTMHHNIIFWQRIQRRLAKNAEVYIYGIKHRDMREAKALIDVLGMTLGATVYVSDDINGAKGYWRLRSGIIR